MKPHPEPAFSPAPTPAAWLHPEPRGGADALTVHFLRPSGLPAAGDGPFTYTLIAANDNDVDDVLLLARGHIIVAHL